MGAVVDGGHDADQALANATGEIANGRPEAPAEGPPRTGRGRRRRRNVGGAILGLLRRLWIPLVIVAVVGAGGLAVSRLHRIFGSERSVGYGDSGTETPKPYNPKRMRYEVFGPAGTVADISYFDANGDPRFDKGVPLPWSTEFPITTAASIGSIAAQGDSPTIGCRILVDGVVKSDKVENHEISSFVSCILKAG